MEQALAEGKIFFPDPIPNKIKPDLINLDSIIESSSGTHPSRKRLVSFHTLSPHISSSSNSSSITGSPKSQRTRTKTINNPSKFKLQNPLISQESNANIIKTDVLNKKTSGNESPEDKIRKILSTPKRTQEDALFIYNKLKHNEFFNKFKECNTELHEAEAMLYVCRYLGYERYPPGKVVLQEGDEANGRLYLIFTGEVSIAVKRPHFYTRENLQQTNEGSNSVTSLHEMSKNSNPDSKLHTEKYDPFEPKFEDEDNDNFVNIFKKSPTMEEGKINQDKKDHDTGEKSECSIAFSIFRGQILWKKLLSVMTFANVAQHAQQKRNSSMAMSFSSAALLAQKRTSIVSPLLPPKENSEKELPSPLLENKNSPGKDGPFKFTTKMKTQQVTTLQLEPISEMISERKDGVDRHRTIIPHIEAVKEVTKTGRRNSTAFIKRNAMSSSMILNTLAIVNTPEPVEEEARDVDKIAEKYGVVINKLGKGTFFGEKALYSQKPRSATIITNTECEFLTISQELFNFIKSKFEKTNTKKLNFLMDNFPDIELTKNRNFLENLLYLLEEKNFNLHAGLTIEGAKGNNFYVLVKGVCNVYKKFSLNEPGVAKLRKYGDHEGSEKSDGILICQIFPGTFIGEEIVYNGTGQYEFTVKAASSQVVAIEIDKSKFNVRFPKHAISGLKKVYQKKAQHYADIGQERAKLKSDIVHIARSERKKKVNLAPGEVSAQNTKPKTVSQVTTIEKLSEKPPVDFLDKRTSFKKRIITFKQYTHKLPLSARQLEPTSLEDFTIYKSALSPMTARTREPTSASLKIKLDKTPATTITKFDFGGGEDMSPRDKTASTPSKTPAKNMSPKSINPDSPMKEQKPFFSLKRVSNEEDEVLGIGLRLRVEKSKRRSKRYFETVVPMSRRDLSSNIQTATSLFSNQPPQSSRFSPAESKYGSLTCNILSVPTRKGTLKPVTSDGKGNLLIPIEERPTNAKSLGDFKGKMGEDYGSTPYFSNTMYNKRGFIKSNQNVISNNTLNKRFSTEVSIEKCLERAEMDYFGRYHDHSPLRQKTSRDQPSSGREGTKRGFHLKKVSLEAAFLSGIVQTEPDTRSFTLSKR